MMFSPHVHKGTTDLFLKTCVQEDSFYLDGLFFIYCTLISFCFVWFWFVLAVSRLGILNLFNFAGWFKIIASFINLVSSKWRRIFRTEHVRYSQWLSNLLVDFASKHKMSYNLEKREPSKHLSNGAAAAATTTGLLLLHLLVQSAGRFNQWISSADINLPFSLAALKNTEPAN